MSDRTPASGLGAVRDAKKELLARLLAEAGLAVPGAAIPRRAPGSVTPLSHAQEVIWLLDRATPGLTAYNSVLAYRLHGAVDVVALERALDQLVTRHEALRTRFVSNGDHAVQVVDPAGVQDCVWPTCGVVQRVSGPPLRRVISRRLRVSASISSATTCSGRFWFGFRTRNHSSCCWLTISFVMRGRTAS